MDTTATPIIEQPAVPAVETPVERTPVESSGSLADHREQFPSEKRSTRAVEAARQAVQAEHAPAAIEKKRNRARSQDASPDELKAISALGREAREIEEAVSESLGLKARDGESPRLFELRRRKEIAEAVKTLKATPAVAAVEAPRPAPSILSTTSNAAEPDASDATKYPYGVADPKYLRDLTAFTVAETIRSEETKRETAQREQNQKDWQKNWAERWNQAKSEIPNFDAIASRPVPWQTGDPIDLWIRARQYGPKLLHYLLQPEHSAETREIMALPVEDQLERLVAIGNGLSKNPAGVNGNHRSVEPATVVTPSPRLPTPVKTGPMTRSSEPPDPSSMSLRQFRETYHANTRRRR